MWSPGIRVLTEIVRCDGVIGSDKGLDHCDTCGGDNSTCRIVSGLYTMPHLPYGYHLIATIPKGACDINITEMKSSENFLALRHLNGSYILNGDYIINWSASYEAVGTVFSYQQDTVPYKVEWLHSKGPTMEAIDVMIFSRQSDSSVKYEYTLPLKETTTSWPKLVHTPLYTISPTSNDTSPRSHSHHSRKGRRKGRHRPKNRTGHRVQRRRKLGAKIKRQHFLNRLDNTLTQDDNPVALDAVQQSSEAGNETSIGTNFKWHVSGSAECSRSCGGGIRKSIVICVKELDLTMVADHYCDLLRPDTRTTRCNTKPCPPEWTTTAWSNCTANCGEGTKKRDITCKQVVSSSLQITVPEHLCVDKRPDDTQKCNLDPCFHNWKTSKWSECSVQCGKGVRKRRVTCNDQQSIVLQDDKCDVTKKPSMEETCDRGPCSLTGKWFFSVWSSQCFADCGQGLQLRRANCLDEKGTSQYTCSANEKPEVMRSCNSGRSCKGRWFTGPWQPCSSSCGPGFQRREIICLSLYRGQYQMTNDAMCVKSEKPSYEQPCHLKSCAPEWFTTDWNQCSQSCNTGFQLREVKCMDGNLKLSHDCDKTKMPPVRQDCNTEKCVLERLADSGCTDKYSNCHLVVQARMCRYPYYHTICCHSCYNQS